MLRTAYHLAVALIAAVLLGGAAMAAGEARAAAGCTRVRSSPS